MKIVQRVVCFSWVAPLLLTGTGVASEPAFCSLGADWPVWPDECVATSTNGSGTFTGVFNSCGYDVVNSRWFSFIGTGGTITASTCNLGTDFDTRITISDNLCDGSTTPTGFDITLCVGSSMQTIDVGSIPGCTNQSAIVTLEETVLGVTYYVGIDGRDGESTGEFFFSISLGNSTITPLCSTSLAPTGTPAQSSTADGETLATTLTTVAPNDFPDIITSGGFGNVVPDPLCVLSGIGGLLLLQSL